MIIDVETFRDKKGTSNLAVIPRWPNEKGKRGHREKDFVYRADCRNKGPKTGPG